MITFIYKTIITMKSIIRTSILSIFSLVFLSSCFVQSDAKPHTILQQYSKINGVDISSGFKVSITKGDSPCVKISVADRFKDDLVVKVEDGILHLYIDGWVKYLKGDELSAEIVCSDLSKVKVSGAVSVDINSPFSVHDLEMSASSASKIICHESIVIGGDCEIAASGASVVDLDVKTKKIEIRASGASSINMNGSADSMIIKASGASNVDCDNNVAAAAKVWASGASSIYVGKVKRSVEVNASGASKIRYESDASVIIESNMSGGSSLNKR